MKKRDRTDYVLVSATNTTPKKDLKLKDIDLQDRKRGFFSCVYHFLIRRDGEVERGRPYENHAMGLGYKLNALTVSICLVGGQGEPPFTVQQDTTLRDLVMELREEYPEAALKFHMTFPETEKTRLEGILK